MRSDTVKHRSLLTILNESGLEIVVNEIENREDYKGWWYSPQDKGTAVYARGVPKVVMLGTERS